jgi:L-2-hydroxycarboxylate dehydrogenase (NAD+)
MSSAQATEADLLHAPARATSSLIAEVFVAAGLPGADAARCAELMTQADLTGADGHGIFRLPQYVRRLKARGFNKRPNITVSRTAPASALVDGDNGMGHLVMSRPADEAVAMARDAGMAWVGVRRSNHAGPAGLYAEMPAALGMVGLYAAVANANHMATWDGADLLLGTNPLAIGVPTGDAPLVFDMATSIVAYGTVKKYALRGVTMREGWFVDAQSEAPITDLNRSAAGLLLPMGEYKGSGLALMIGLIAGVLNGAAFGRESTPTTRARPIPVTSSPPSTSRAFCRYRLSPPRSIVMCAICARRGSCPASMPSACPATAAPRVAPSDCATACRFPSRFWRSSIRWRRNCFWIASLSLSSGRPGRTRGSQ